jgi:glutaryl-CoA dehydrogenase (non-decarboxylating)
MDFSLTEEHQLLEQSVREWAGREVSPHIAELDRAHRFDPRILPQMAGLGLLGVCVPHEYGGAGRSRSTSCRRPADRRLRPSV